MPSWDVDKALLALEAYISTTCLGTPGTSITRVLLDVSLMRDMGLKIAPGEKNRQSVFVWALSVGPMLAPKTLFYGRTVHEACRRATKTLRADKATTRQLNAKATPKPKARKKKAKP